MCASLLLTPSDFMHLGLSTSRAMDFRLFFSIWIRNSQLETRPMFFKSWRKVSELDPFSSYCSRTVAYICLQPDMAAALRKPAQSAAGIQPPPFPPALIAYGAACPIAEAYASSYPLSALQLINPPLSMERAKQRYPLLFGDSNIREFDFEATFPVRVTWTPDELAWQAQHQVPWYEVHRIEHQREDAADESLDRYEWDSFEHGVQDTVCWLEDEAGLYVCSKCKPKY